MVYTIAEIGMNHDGSLGQAKAFIKAAVECGADAVKFQTHIAQAETLPEAPAPGYFDEEPRYEYFKRTALSLEQHNKLKRYAEDQGVEFISSPFSLEAVDLLEQVGICTYKIASGEVTNTPLLLRLAKAQKRILLSSGMSSWAELDEAVDTLRNNGAENIVLLQCTSEYPCPPEHAGLNVMLEMKERYNLPVGLSDHTFGIGIAIAAAALGAEVVEKHFTLSKKMYGPDAKNSATPEEFKALVDGIRVVEKALSNHVDKDRIADSVSHMKVVFEKSIVAACDIPAGTILQESHLAYKKPGDGIPAKEFRNIIGKRCMVSTKADEQIEYHSLARD
jgi:N-acetylneuraminate synthase